MKYLSGLKASLITAATFTFFVAAAIGAVGVAAEGDPNLSFLDIVVYPFLGIVLLFSLINLIILKKTPEGKEPFFFKMTPFDFLNAFAAEFLGINSKKE